MQFILYFLMFLFGMVTYRTFFVYRMAHASLFILRMAQRTSLIMMVRALENYAYAKTFCTQQLKKNGASNSEIDNFKIYINNDIDHLKQQSIKEMNKVLPSYFEHSVVFEDWESAMIFLESINLNNKYFKNL